MVTIYALRCAVNGKAYIGCTAGKLSKRMREHRCLLKSGKHSEKGLLSDWQQHGEAAFSIEVVREFADASVDEKRAAEKAAMQDYANRGLLYNRNRLSFEISPEAHRLGVEASRHVEGRKRSPEANLKRRLAQLGIPKGHGAKISATKRARQVIR